ncbi:hypothetical protein [Methylotenera sp.]|uniref:hypothetical protein n=1 Tax=Methylotenera sp. TaxID=2051956 RepID=UPI002ED7C775
MSLLIKALATAEKDKEKANKAGRSEALSSDALSLSPLELELDNAKVVASSDEGAMGNHVESFALAQDNGVFKSMDLSLAEEAGLISTDTKPKEDALTKQVAEPKQAATKAKSKADAFNEAAMASVANLKAQADVAKGNQKAAASVFVANHAAKTASSRTALLLLGVAGALMILLGLQGYKYIKALGTSEVVVVTPAPPPAANVAVVEDQVSPEPEVAASPQDGVDGAIDGVADVVATKAQDSGTVVNPALEKHKLAESKIDEPMSAGEPAAGDATLVRQQSAAVTTRKPAKVEEAVRRESATTESSEPLRLISKAQAAGVDPTLLGAYEAFNRGDDASAQQKYRQVLQRDVRNVDALLGMAAIAQRQARNMDALGWYRKVTEIEPRNSIAQSAMADLEANTDAVGAESKIKSMLARQPEAANLHAALGNLYAAQNQWASAQAAYFSASQFAPISADYAFNLAISLEHLGKPKLALVQYQRALDLLNMTGASSPDRAQVEARVRALQ